MAERVKWCTRPRSMTCAILCTTIIVGSFLLGLQTSLLDPVVQHDLSVDWASAAPGPFDDYLHRVSYRHNQSATPVDFDPRRSVTRASVLRFACSKRIVLIGWWDDPVEPLASFMRAVRNVSSCDISTFGTLEASQDGREQEHVMQHLNASVDIVLWWNWGAAAETMERARKMFPHQVWVLLNWDDPYSLFMAGNMHARKHLFDVVFSSSTAALPTYMQSGAKEAHAFVPMVDDIHYYDPDPEYDADVVLAASNPYNYPGTYMNRTALLEVFVEDARRTGLRLHIYGPERVGNFFPEFYKGPIRYEENRKVYANARVSINYQVVPGFGGWYANARNTEILGSRGLLVVDEAVKGPLTDQECVFWRSSDPREMVKQVHEILRDYGRYEAIRDRGHAYAITHFSPKAHATRILEAISRVTTLI